MHSKKAHDVSFCLNYYYDWKEVFPSPERQKKTRNKSSLNYDLLVRRGFPLRKRTKAASAISTILKCETQ